MLRLLKYYVLDVNKIHEKAVYKEKVYKFSPMSLKSKLEVIDIINLGYALLFLFAYKTIYKYICKYIFLLRIETLYTLGYMIFKLWYN